MQLISTVFLVFFLENITHNANYTPAGYSVEKKNRSSWWSDISMPNVPV